jgi:hypothetical protein
MFDHLVVERKDQLLFRTGRHDLTLAQVCIVTGSDDGQYTAPRAVIGQSCSTRPPRMPTYQS